MSDIRASYDIQKLDELTEVLRDGGMHGAAERVRWAADEIDRLEAALAQAERERDEVRALPPSRPDRETLGRLAWEECAERDCWDEMSETARERWRCIAEVVAAAIPPAAPAAIVQRVTGDFHLFEDAMEAELWMRANQSPEHGYFNCMSVQQWTWHPAALGESGEAAQS
jgi:hypothetical protein